MNTPTPPAPEAPTTDEPAAPGRLAFVQEFVNTRDIEAGIDSLETPGGRVAFGLAARDVGAAKEVREALREACLAHAGHGTSEALDALLAGPGARLRVAVTEGGGARLVTAPGADGLLGRIALAVAEASAEGTWPRLKACEAGTCRWVYYDRSPGGRRRWCSMAVCGARAKMRSYRARRAGA